MVRLGRRRAAWAFAALIAVAYAGVLALPLAGLSRASWGGLLGLPLAWVAARRLIRVTATAEPNDGAAELNPAQVATLLSFVLMAIGLGLGLTLSATLT